MYREREREREYNVRHLRRAVDRRAAAEDEVLDLEHPAHLLAI